MSLPIATLSDWHIVVLFLLGLLLFGGKKLPELARGMGEAMREFKKASRDIHDEPQPPASQPPPPSASVPQNPSETKHS